MNDRSNMKRNEPGLATEADIRMDTLSAQRLWNRKVRNLTPYTPGEQPRIQRLIKLNTNENPYPPPPAVVDAIRAYPADRLRLYPDPASVDLRRAIADYYGLTSDNVFVGNGSDEVLAFAFQAFFEKDGPTVLFPDITYSFYPVYARMFDIPYRTPTLDERFRIRVDDYRTPGCPVVLANPNAPTGIALAEEAIFRILEADRDRLVLVDEAYVDFGAQSAAVLLGSFDNLLVVQTFSKSRSLAGLRIGFALGSPALVQALERIRDSINSYTLDSLAQAAAIAALASGEWFETACLRLIGTRERCVRQLSKLGFDVLPSSANFLFVRHPDKDAVWLYQKLRQEGILVRHFNMDRIDRFLRISIGTDEEMDALYGQLKRLVESES